MKGTKILGKGPTVSDPHGHTPRRPHRTRWLKVVPGTGGFGGYQAILWDAKHHVYWGASEMRKDGEALGY